jgi:xylan 1,4-beta-xylosidase
VFPFGHGLHYTNFSTTITPPTTNTFKISSLVPKSTQKNQTKYLDQNAFITLPIKVKNTGHKSSSFVALVFLSGSFGPQPYPIKSLVGYQRAKDIQPGGSKTVKVSLTLASLARADEAGNIVLWPGQYRLAVDVDGRVGWNFTLTGTQVTLDSWPAAPAA